VTEIKKRSSCIYFLEGETINGRAHIYFQLRAFIPSHHLHFGHSWRTLSLLKLIFHMFTQFHNFTEVEYLFVIFPLKYMKENPFHGKVNYLEVHDIFIIRPSFIMFMGQSHKTLATKVHFLGHTL